MKKIDRQQLVTHLVALGTRLRSLPEKVVKEAGDANPWFTEYYVQIAVKHVLPWFELENLYTFLASYPPLSGNAARIGIIMAGNLPLVGLHDLIICWLSGNIAVVKASHQDRVLMTWIIEEMLEIAPEMRHFVEMTDHPQDLDYLIATGSDNSSRYFRATYPNVPKTIRGNRFSVVVIHENLEAEQLKRLIPDIFLFNGLGCRNISNVLVKEGVDVHAMLEVWDQVPDNQLNPLYLQNVRRQLAIQELVNGKSEHTRKLVGVWRKNLQPSSMGVLNFVPFSSQKIAEGQLRTYHTGIQCVVDSPEMFGQTQSPGLHDFSDGVNTMELLLSLN